MSHPYSYDPIVLFDTGETGTDSAYSDRMVQWDCKKFREAMDQVGEMAFRWHNKNKVNSFIRKYYNDETLEIVKVIEMCDVSSGYPVWLLVWKKNDVQEK